MPGLAHLNTRPDAYISSLSCASTGNCTAGGYYYSDSSGQEGAFVVSQTNGKWGDAEEVPGTATLNNPGSEIDILTVSCAAAGDCAAGGDYDGCPGDENCGQVFVVTQKNGKWGDAEEVPGTPTLNVGNYALLDSMSCASALQLRCRRFLHR